MNFADPRLPVVALQALDEGPGGELLARLHGAVMPGPQGLVFSQDMQSAVPQIVERRRPNQAVGRHFPPLIIALFDPAWNAKAHRAPPLSTRLFFCPPVDIPMEEAYLLCHVQRTEYRSAEIGSPTRDARPDGIESPRCARAAAWVWDRPPDRA